MRRLLLALALAGCAPANPLPPLPTRVQLELSPRADFQEVFRATLDTVPNGAACRCEYDLADEHRRQTVYLNRARLDQVLEGLGQAGALDLTDGDCGDPEPVVLYTRLEVTCGGFHRVSRWRGLTPEQGRVAQALLDSPLGPEIQAGLAAVRRRKLVAP